METELTSKLLVAQQVHQGILPTRGSLMLDVVLLAMIVVVAVLSVSIYLVRYRRQYVLHRNIQITLATLLAITLVAFEVDLRLFADWREQASFSPYYDSGVVYFALLIHLVFAIPTPIVWIFVIVRACRNFDPVQPGRHSQSHKFWGRLAAIMMLITAVTGWVFYWLAFVA